MFNQEAIKLLNGIIDEIRCAKDDDFQPGYDFYNEGITTALEILHYHVNKFEQLPNDFIKNSENS